MSEDVEPRPDLGHPSEQFPVADLFADEVRGVDDARSGLLALDQFRQDVVGEVDDEHSTPLEQVEGNQIRGRLG
jgi:hypothetical protein